MKFIVDRFIRNICEICEDVVFFLFYVLSLITFNGLFFSNWKFLLKEILHVCGMFLPVILYFSAVTWSIWLFTPGQLIAVHIIALLFYENHARCWRGFLGWFEEILNEKKTKITGP